MRIVAAAFALLAAACGGGEGSPAAADTLTVAAYTAPREALDRAVIPAFRAAWKARTGRDAIVRASYLGSGAQARAVIQGFEADVVVLALDSDVDQIAEAGLITPGWRDRAPHAGAVAKSLVVIAVRNGNPTGIQDWADLARPEAEVVLPNPRTSGGAMWNLVAIYGAALRGMAGVPAGDARAAADFVRSILGRVIVMDKGARESLINFERGIGSAAVTYEQEVHVARLAGRDYDYVIPSSTVSIEIAGAVVDRVVEARGSRALAEAFVTFLASSEGQRALAGYGFRPVEGGPDVPGDPRFPPVGDVFDIGFLGGWARVRPELFGQGGSLTRAVSEGAFGP